jgi:hypothetical protein
MDADVGAGGGDCGGAFIALTEAAGLSSCVKLSLYGAPLITFDPPVIEFDRVPVTPPPGAFP